MRSRGILSVIFEPADGRWPGGSREIFTECARRALLSARISNPALPICLVDASGVLSTDERHVLKRWLTVLDGRGAGMWTRSKWDKVVAAMCSPFDETLILDLDFFVVGDLGQAFDETVGALGVLGYPNYDRTTNRINTGLAVVRDTAILGEWMRGRAPQRRLDDDERGLDRLITNGKMEVTRLSPLYGLDRGALWSEGAGGGGFTSWGERREDWTRTPPVFWSGSHVVRAYHLSGAYARMATDPTVARYVVEGLRNL